jgi:hypothetical protein
MNLDAWNTHNPLFPGRRAVTTITLAAAMAALLIANLPQPVPGTPAPTMSLARPALGQVPTQTAVDTDTSRAPAPVAVVAHTRHALGRELAAPPAIAKMLDELLELHLAGDRSSDGRFTQLLQMILARGPESIRAVRDRLMDGEIQDSIGAVEPGEFSAGNLLLDLLLSLDDPGVEPAAFELLVQTRNPWMVTRLGLYLDGQQPGLYDPELQRAAEQALLAADRDAELPAGLFDLLGRTGDRATLAVLDAQPMHRDAYVSVALSLIPDGSGLNLLMEDALSFEQGLFTQRGRLAIELLAQQAHRSESAAAILLSLVENNRVPSDLWSNLVDLLAGTSQITFFEPGGSGYSIYQFRQSGGIQNLYFANRPGVAENPDILLERILLLTQLQGFVPTARQPQIAEAIWRLELLRITMTQAPAPGEVYFAIEYSRTATSTPIESKQT